MAYKIYKLSNEIHLFCRNHTKNYFNHEKLLKHFDIFNGARFMVSEVYHFSTDDSTKINLSFPQFLGKKYFFLRLEKSEAWIKFRKDKKSYTAGAKELKYLECNLIVEGSLYNRQFVSRDS